MENQYNYYTSDQNMNTENYSTGGNQDQGPKKKHGKGASRWAKVVCTGLVFGVVASAAFQTSNIVAGKVLGTTQTTNKTAKTTTTLCSGAAAPCRAPHRPVFIASPIISMHLSIALCKRISRQNSSNNFGCPSKNVSMSSIALSISCKCFLVKLSIY